VSLAAQTRQEAHGGCLVLAAEGCVAGLASPTVLLVVQGELKSAEMLVELRGSARADDGTRAVADRAAWARGQATDTWRLAWR
jgi:hypothetical protein